MMRVQRMRLGAATPLGAELRHLDQKVRDLFDHAGRVCAFAQHTARAGRM